MEEYWLRRGIEVNDLTLGGRDVKDEIVSAVCRDTKITSRAPKKKLNKMKPSSDNKTAYTLLTFLLTHLWFTL